MGLHGSATLTHRAPGPWSPDKVSPLAHCRLLPLPQRLSLIRTDFLVTTGSRRKRTTCKPGRTWSHGRPAAGFGQPLATGFKLVKVADGLRRAPRTPQRQGDAHQVGLTRP